MLLKQTNITNVSRYINTFLCYCLQLESADPGLLKIQFMGWWSYHWLDWALIEHSLLNDSSVCPADKSGKPPEKAGQCSLLPKQQNHKQWIYRQVVEAFFRGEELCSQGMGRSIQLTQIYSCQIYNLTSFSCNFSCFRYSCISGNWILQGPRFPLRFYW